MKLNCKPGDLAVVVVGHDHPQYPGVMVLKPGEIVRVTHMSDDGMWLIEERIKFFAIVDKTLYATGEITQIADSHLRPIRDNPGEDETLQWLEVPRKVAA